MLKLRTVYVVFALITICASAFVAIGLRSEAVRLEDAALKNAKAEADTAADAIVGQLRQMQERGDALAARMTRREIPLSDINDVLRGELADRTTFGAGVAFVRGALGEGLPPEDRSWYAFRQKGEILYKPKEYEYTEPQNAWFVDAVSRGKGLWKEPHVGRTSRAFITGYSVPFFTDETHTEVRGVVTLNYSLSELHELMRRAAIWDTGYAVIFSRKGRLIYHPDALIAQQAEIGPDASDAVRNEYPLLCRLAEQDGASDESFRKTVDAQGRPVWTMSLEIHGTEWTEEDTVSKRARCVLVYYRDEVLAQSDLSRRYRRWLIVTSILAVISSALALLYQKGLTPLRLWGLTSVVSLAFITGILIIWQHNMEARKPSPEGREKLFNMSEIERVRKEVREQSFGLGLGEPIFVPTGLFIRSLTFTSANDVVVNGYVWQQYRVADFTATDESPARLAVKGLVFVEAFESDIDLVEGEKNYSHTEDGIETVVWHFKITLRQKFGYEQYPLDHETVWLRLRYVDADHNVTLLPDLDAYALVYEGANPGIDARDFILPGWRLDGTNFMISRGERPSSLGFRTASVMSASPELYFNVNIQRNFLDPFISNVTPVMMIFLILFVVMLNSTADAARAASFGFNSFAVLGMVGALLFSTLYLHAGLRESLASPSVTYFECFYILGYVVMILVALNATMLSGANPPQFIRRDHNLLPKLLFWPVVTGSIFFVTLIKLQV